MAVKYAAAGFSVSRLETLDRFLQSRYIDAGKIPGALILIFTDLRWARDPRNQGGRSRIPWSRSRAPRPAPS